MERKKYKKVFSGIIQARVRLGEKACIPGTGVRVASFRVLEKWFKGRLRVCEGNDLDLGRRFEEMGNKKKGWSRL